MVDVIKDGTPESQRIYARREMEELEAPLAKLCGQLAEGFREGKYALIIGDDTSGRIPTLVIRGFANHLRKQQGQREIPTIFLDLSKDTDVMGIADQLKKRVPESDSRSGNRALLVTEWMNSGGTMARALQMLSDRKGIAADVVTLGTSPVYDRGFHKQELSYRSAEVFSGDLKMSPSIYQNVAVSGLMGEWKDGTRTIKPIARTFRGYQKWVNESRGDVNLMVQRIVAQVFPTEQTQQAA